MPLTPFCLSESPLEALLAQTEPGTPNTSKKSLIWPPFWRAFGTNILLELERFFTHLLNASWEPFGPIFQRNFEGLGSLLGLTSETFWGTCDSLFFATPLTRKPHFARSGRSQQVHFFHNLSSHGYDLVLESILMTSWHPFEAFWAPIFVSYHHQIRHDFWDPFKACPSGSQSTAIWPPKSLGGVRGEPP